MTLSTLKKFCCFFNKTARGIGFFASVASVARGEYRLFVGGIVGGHDSFILDLKTSDLLPADFHSIKDVGLLQVWRNAVNNFSGHWTDDLMPLPFNTEVENNETCKIPLNNGESSQNEREGLKNEFEESHENNQRKGVNVGTWGFGKCFFYNIFADSKRKETIKSAKNEKDQRRASQNNIRITAIFKAIFQAWGNRPGKDCLTSRNRQVGQFSQVLFA